MSKFYKVIKRCGNCNTENHISLLEAASGYTDIDLDFRVHSEGVNPLDFLVMRCENCSYVNYVDIFEKQTTPKVKELIASSYFTKLLQTKKISNFEIAGEIETISNAPKIRIAFSFLRASWIYNDKKQSFLEKNSIEKSRKFFQMAVDEAVNNTNIARR